MMSANAVVYVSGEGAADQEQGAWKMLLLKDFNFVYSSNRCRAQPNLWKLRRSTGHWSFPLPSIVTSVGPSYYPIDVTFTKLTGLGGHSILRLLRIDMQTLHAIYSTSSPN